jgi:hypothetical protein
MRMLPVAIATLLTIAAAPARAADNGSGHFRMGEDRATFSHAVAVRNEHHLDPAEDEIYVFLSDRPLDPAILLDAFGPDDGASDSYGERAGAFLRICIAPDGHECGLYLQRVGGGGSFNTSGSGELVLSAHDRTRIAGRWQLAEPEDFFDKTYDFDLRFDAAVHHPPGNALPAGGGDAGAAYRRYADAVAKGDLAALRPFLGDNAAWRLPDDDRDRARETLKDLRDGQPLAPEILRGRRHDNTVVLWIRGTDRDDITREGRVRMRRRGDAWTVEEHDLETVEGKDD